ncbi:MAG: LPS export ABC transporter permease LptG [Paracoccus denitrificans]|nr:MAG: LPS export ABC transporter permease LptG [Paracoccus denitrificans]PZO85179.1 MAG: LPS export ABC transporter permease LptG [Paracoccus denitrificans]
MILQVYLARRYLRSFLLVAFSFLAILFLIDLIEQIRRYAGQDPGLAWTARMAALNIAGSFYAILPLMALLAGIALFLNLSRTSELVAIRAAGRSGLRAVMAPTVTAALIGVLSVAFLNPLVAATQRAYSESSALLNSDGGQTITLGGGAVWLRQGLPPVSGQAQGGQVVIRAAGASPDATTLYNATFLVFTPGHGPSTRVEAQSARLEKGAWLLTGVKSWPLDDPNPEAAAGSLPGARLPTDLTAERIRDGFGSPDAIPIWQLPAFIDGLKRAGFTAMRHQVWFAMELARPLLMAAMVMIAAAFTMRPMRGRRVGILVLAAFACGLGLFFLRNLAQVMGETADVAPSLAAFAPPLVAALLALAMLLKIEDG